MCKGVFSMSKKTSNTLVEHFFNSDDLSLTPLYEDIYMEARRQTASSLSRATDDILGTFEKDVDLTSENPLPQDIIPLGTIYVAEWGYEQTNVSFFEVVGFSGSKTVLLKRLQSKTKPVGSAEMSGYTKPVKGSYVDDTIYKARVRWESRKNRNELPSLKIGKNPKYRLFVDLYLFPTKETETHYTTWYA